MLVNLLRGAIAIGIFLPLPVHAQSLGAVRGLLREGLHDVAFAQSFAGIVLTADDLELAGANYRIDDAVDSELTVISLPFSTTWKPNEASWTGLYFEGALGYARASEQVSDIYSGAIPGGETSVDADWTTYAALVGTGVEFEVVPDLTLTPIVNLGLAHIESEADYSGPGASVTRALLDGLAFNWESFAVSYGGALRAEWRHALTTEHELSVRGRYDLRWTDSFEEDDPAQEFSTRLQALTLRTDLVGPTGFEPLGGALRWRTNLVYRRFLEGDFDGVVDLFQVGGALELDEVLPLDTTLTLSGAVIFGDDVDGWAIGVGLRF